MSIGLDRHVAGTIVTFEPRAIIFAQGARAATVVFITRGRVRLSVAGPGCRTAVTATLSAGTFCGEGALAGQRRRRATAEALTATTVTIVETATLRRRLREDVVFSDWFRAHLLARNARIEEDFTARCFNSTEKRLARTLMLLAGVDDHPAERYALPTVSRYVLADAVGAACSRVDSMMASFRKRGFIERGRQRSDLQLHRSIVSVLLAD
jgi:CRP-like cAMP-binding protein